MSAWAMLACGLNRHEAMKQRMENSYQKGLAIRSVPSLDASFDAFVATIDMRGVTTTTLSSSPNPSLSGQAVTFTAEVTASAGAPPDGETVTFMEGTKVLGTGALDSGSASVYDLDSAGGVSTRSRPCAAATSSSPANPSKTVKAGAELRHDHLAFLAESVGPWAVCDVYCELGAAVP
jgi:Big-like domain-containing protein